MTGNMQYYKLLALQQAWLSCKQAYSQAVAVDFVYVVSKYRSY